MANTPHTHQQPMQASFNKAFAIAVFVNLAFTLIEAAYAIAANSMSLLADAGHNLGDVLGLVLAWGANWLLSKPSSKRYSYGFKRTTILAAIINALLLVATSSIIAFESITKLFAQQPVNEWVVIIVSSVGIVINMSSALLFLRGRKQDLNIKGAFLHLALDAIISFGVVITALVMLWSGWVILDPLVGLLIVLIIIASTWGLLRDSVNLLLDSVPRYINHQQVTHYFQSIKGVAKIHDLHIWGLSTKEVALTVHLIMPGQTLSDEQLYTINQEVKDQFNISHVTIQVESGNSHPCSLEGIC